MRKTRWRWVVLAAVLIGMGGNVCSGYRAEAAVEKGGEESLDIESQGEPSEEGNPSGENAPIAQRSGDASSEGSATEPSGEENSEAQRLGETSGKEGEKDASGEGMPGSNSSVVQPSTELPSGNETAVQPSTEPPSGNEMIVQPSTELPSGNGTAVQPSTEPTSGNGTAVQPSTEPSDSTPSTETPTTNASSEEIYLGIDNQHAYEGMEQSFAKGYQPSVKKKYFSIVIPFVCNGGLKGDKITVDLEFQESQEAPFEYKNYQKDVSKKTYTFETKTGTETMEAYLYQCRVSLLEGAAEGQYPVTVKASAYTEKGEKITLDYQLYVRIPAKDQNVIVIGGQEEPPMDAGSYAGGGAAESEEIIHQPKMLLESNNLSGKTLKTGGEETLAVTFKNRSRERSMYNLKVTLSTENQGLLMERNSFYFSKVAPGEEISIENQIKITKNVTAENIPLLFTFEYEDEKGSAATGTESVSLSVSQPVRMEIETADIPAVLYASETVEIPVKALNLSRVGVYNVRFSLEGTGLFPKEEVFLGNMEAGSGGEGSMRVYVGTRTMEAIGNDPGSTDQEKYGQAEGKLTLTYEDADGNQYTETKDYQTEIKKAEILALKVTEEEQEANSWWLSVFAVLILSMAVMILLLVWRLRRKNILLEEARKEAGHEKW